MGIDKKFFSRVHSKAEQLRLKRRGNGHSVKKITPRICFLAKFTLNTKKYCSIGGIL